MTSLTYGMLRSVWSGWFDTNQGAFVMVLRIFDWECITKLSQRCGVSIAFLTCARKIQASACNSTQTILRLSWFYSVLQEIIGTVPQITPQQLPTYSQFLLPNHLLLHNGKNTVLLLQNKWRPPSVHKFVTKAITITIPTRATQNSALLNKPSSVLRLAYRSLRTTIAAYIDRLLSTSSSLSYRLPFTQNSALLNKPSSVLLFPYPSLHTTRVNHNSPRQSHTNERGISHSEWCDVRQWNTNNFLYIWRDFTKYRYRQCEQYLVI